MIFYSFSEARSPREVAPEPRARTAPALVTAYRQRLPRPPVADCAVRSRFACQSRRSTHTCHALGSEAQHFVGGPHYRLARRSPARGGVRWRVGHRNRSWNGALNLTNEHDGSSGQKPYSVEDLDEMLRLLTRAAKDKTVCTSRRLEELLVHAIKGPASPEEAAGWTVPQADARSHQEKVALFEEAAASPDPLALFAPSDVDFTRLSQRVGLQWAKRWNKPERPKSLRGEEWRSLSAAAQEEVREACRFLAAYERLLVSPGRPPREDLTTYLELLADLFIQLTGSPKASWQLPSDPKSRFIQFATLAIRPFSTESSANPGALSSRWKDHIRGPNRAAQAELEIKDSIE